MAMASSLGLTFLCSPVLTLHSTPYSLACNTEVSLQRTRFGFEPHFFTQQVWNLEQALASSPVKGGSQNLWESTKDHTSNIPSTLWAPNSVLTLNRITCVHKDAKKAVPLLHPYYRHGNWGYVICKRQQNSCCCGFPHCWPLGVKQGWADIVY